VLILGSRILSTPVMSLQTGVKLASAIKPVIDPGKLYIYAYELDGPLLTEKGSYLRTADIREMGSVGMIVDSADEFITPSDIIQLEELLTLGFPLIGMKVVDEHRRKLGKVEDYTLESSSFYIQQLNIKRGVLRGITDTGLLINRAQIVEITDDYIVVKGNDIKTESKASVIPNAEYVNPFRQHSPAPDQRDA
jgi:uncharacterized protein YrrD